MPKSIGDLMQSADWKTEKRVPVIECPDKVGKDQLSDASEITYSFGVPARPAFSVV